MQGQKRKEIKPGMEVEDHFEIFKLIYDERFERQYGFFRSYVKQVIYRYLDCDVLKKAVRKTTPS